MRTQQQLAEWFEAALDNGGHLVVRFAHDNMKQLTVEEVSLLVATLKAAPPSQGGSWKPIELVQAGENLGYALATFKAFTEKPGVSMKQIREATGRLEDTRALIAEYVEQFAASQGEEK